MKKSRLAMAATAVLLLTTTGCATGGGNPDVAAKVGNAVITTKQIDDVSNVQCGHKEMNQSAVLRSNVQQQVLATLLQAKEAEAYADAHNVTIPAKDVQTVLDQVLTQVKAFAKPLTGKDLDAFTDAFRQIITAQAIVKKIGTQEVTAAGGSTSNADEVTNAGQNAIGKWATAQGISINPKYAPADNQPGAGSSSLSIAVSTYAKKSVKSPSDAAVLAQTAANLICQ